MTTFSVSTFIYILLMSSYLSCLEDNEFPSTFKFGVATSAYQVEGAWDESGKGDTSWDRLTHGKPNKIADKSNGDISCDAYHKVSEDIQLLKDMKVDFYKFSISWSRILPTGFIKVVNPDGTRFYNDLIDELIRNGIKPVATMFHWDLPQPLQEKGGWTNEELIVAFVDYANLLFSSFGNRVSDWITFDDPCRYCFDMYFQQLTFADGLKQEGSSGFVCAHIVLKAHANVHHLYDTRYREKQRGRVGIALGSTWMEPATQSGQDQDQSELAMELELGWFAHPIFSRDGNYPELVIQQLQDFFNRHIQMASYKIPNFEPEDVEYIKGSTDFLGLSHFTTKVLR